MLKQVLYAGYIDVKKWNISMHPAKHEPLISFEAYKAIQDRMNGQTKAPARADIRDEFPLRGFYNM